MDNKRKMLTVRMKPEIIEEFAIAADLRGQTMSALIYQFVLKTIREEKEREPQAFPGYKAETPVVTPDKQTALQIMYEAFGGEEIRPELMKAIVNAVKMIQTAEQTDVPVLPKRIVK